MQIDKEKYPAHAAVIGWDVNCLCAANGDFICHAKELVAEFNQLLSEHKALLDAVVVYETALPEIYKIATKECNAFTATVSSAAERLEALRKIKAISAEALKSFTQPLYAKPQLEVKE